MTTLNTAATPKILYTSLAEIKSFNPCLSGWRNILKGQGKTGTDDVLFPILEAVESNSISDICWLFGKRKVEIQIYVKFARMCADSVQKYKNAASASATTSTYATSAAAAASAASMYASAAYVASAAAASAAASASTDAAYASAYDAVTAAVAATAAAYVVAYDAYDDATADAYDAAYDDAYDDAYDAAYEQQKELNKQFLIQCINEYQNGTL